MNPVSTVGLDLAKYIFQLHGADSAGAVVFRQTLRRGQLLAFLATLPPCTVAMEACASAHYWGREKWAECFDGIWASASLLQVPRADLPRVAVVFRRALKPGGVWYISFKHGTEEREKDGRRFTDMTDQTLQAVLSTIPGLCAIEVWISEDVR